MSLFSPIGWTDLNVDDYPIVGIGLLTAVPYMFQFIAYTFLVATWASVYHFAMQNRGSSPFAKLRIPFAVANALLGILIFALFGSIGAATNESQAKRIVIAATVIMAIITIVMIILYLVYGSSNEGHTSSTHFLFIDPLSSIGAWK